MRRYPAKRPQWADKDRRMALAVAKRAEGKGLRQIARELGVGHQTVIRDLARFDSQANVVQLHGPNRPARGAERTTSAGQNGPPARSKYFVGTRAEAEAHDRLTRNMS